MKQHPLAASALLVACVAAAYGSALGGAFQFDDYNVIADNAAVHSWSGWFGALDGIRPVLKLTYTLNWTSHAGLFGFHLFNVAVHACNAVMIYFLFRSVEDHSRATPAIAPLAAALAFAVHPVQSEAVTYISGRSTSLMASFYLSSVLAYVHGRTIGSRWWLHAVSPGLFMLAFFTKESALTLPLALVLWEMANARRGQRRETAARAQAWHWAVLVLLLVVLRVHPGYARSLAFALETRSMPVNLLSEIGGVSYLLSRLIWPSHLNIDPALPVAVGWTWPIALQGVVLASMVAGGVAISGRQRAVAFGILWFFLQLVPTNSLVPRLDVANERQLYLASGGLFFAAAAGARAMGAAAAVDRRVIRAGLVALVPVLIFATRVRNQDYRTEVTLWESSVAAAPSNPRAYNNLGFAYALSGDRERARAAYVAALQLRPDYEIARNNLDALSAQPRRSLPK